MNKLGVRDGQKPPMSIFWVSEEMGKALKHLAVDFPALWQKHGQMYGVQITQYLSFKNIPHTLRILVTNIQTYTLHSYKSNFDISFQVSTSIFALLTGLFCHPYHYIQSWIWNVYTDLSSPLEQRGSFSLQYMMQKKSLHETTSKEQATPLPKRAYCLHTVCFSDT